MAHHLSRLRARLIRSPLRRLAGERRTVERLKRMGLRPVDVIEVPIGQLLVQRPVLCEIIPVREATTIRHLDTYFGDDWRIERSMHYRLLEAHIHDALPADLSDTDYWRWHRALHDAGVNERPDDAIAAKLAQFLRLYESMSLSGYVYGGLQSYVWVLERPLISTRYGFDWNPIGYEIVDGHHRAAAAAALGYTSIHVLVLHNVGMETPFGIPLREIVS